MRFLLGIIVGFLLVPCLVYCYFRFGYAPVATSSSPIPFERKLAHMGLNARIDKEAPKNAPFQPTDADYMNGVHIYREHCAVCHGVGGDKTPTAKGMYPPPPQLLKGKGVTDDPAGETFWKVQNGIRLTGMPAYGGALATRDMWDVSLLLANADKVSPAILDAAKQPLKTE